MKNEQVIVNVIRKIKDPYISIITLSELFYGIYNSKNTKKHKKALVQFLSGVHTLDTNFPIANNFGKIKSKLRNKGTLVGDFDIINASFALTYDLILITRNTKHYKNIEGINIKTL